jgi:non-ribosomal peptide synthetase component E (peptide arylation enzyme)
MKTSPARLIEQHRANGHWGDQRIHDLFDAAAAAVPSRLAVVDPPNREALTGDPALRLSFAALAARAEGYALRLQELGLKRDDVLITQLPNIADYVAIYMAAFRLGIIVSPVPMQFRSFELGEITRLTQARAILSLVPPSMPSSQRILPAPTTSPRSAGPRAPRAGRKACRAPTTTGSRSATHISRGRGCAKAMRC